jgi:hypothetical protein
MGTQRLYSQPGSVWISCSYGRPGNINEAWIAKLARQEGNVGTHDVPGKMLMSTYPNPTDDYVNIDIDNPQGKSFTVTVFDINGRPVQVLFDGKPNYTGEASLSFSTKALPVGQYVVQVKMEGEVLVSREIVKQ